MLTERVDKLVAKYIKTSRAMRIEKKTGRAIIDTNFWMRNTLLNVQSHLTAQYEMDIDHANKALLKACLNEVDKRLKGHPDFKDEKLRDPEESVPAKTYRT